MNSNSKTTINSISARILVAAMSFLIIFSGIAFGAFGGITKAYAEGAISWSDLDSSDGDGKTQIEFVSGGKLGNMLQGAERIDKYINTSDIQNGISIVLPSSEDAGQPFRYKDNDENNNYHLAGWALVPNKSEYENGDGTYHTLKNLRYFKPGETVHIDNTFVNSTGTIMFYPDWQPISYNYGSEDDTALGGLRDDVYDGKAIRSDLYDYNALLVNLLNSHIGPRGNWNDNHTGILFVDGEYSDSPTIQRPNDRWAVETEPGYTAVVNEWTGSGGGAAQGLWELANFGMLFDESTPGVNYIGNADNGPMYWYDNNEDSPYYGYYVYDSEQSAAVYNRSQQRFYVYNDPQKGTGYKDWKGFLPFNKARDTAYNAFARGNDAPNYHFGMVTQVDFFLTGDVGDDGANKINLENGTVKDMEFFFSGDDDVYVFVDDTLALDIGGIHDKVSGSINFATGEVKTKRSNRVATGEEVTNPDSIKNLKAGNHRLTIYYMERGSNETNNLTAFCLVLPATLKVQKLDKDTGEPVIYPGAEFYLQNKKGEYYHLDEVTDPDDPLQVPKVSYTSDKTGAYKFVADEDGAVTIKYVADGEYVLTEVGAPEYYEGLPGAFSFEVENAKIVEKSLEFYQDNEYSSNDTPYTDDPDWSDNISIDGDLVTLNVSNERKTLPFELLKDFLDGKNPKGVSFVIKEHWDLPTKKDGDKTVIDTEELPLDKAPEDVTRIVYEGTANSDGKVTNYTYYPLGKGQTPDARIKEGIEDLVLKQGAVYYIEEKYQNDNYYEFKTPIVIYTDEENVYLLSDPEDKSLKLGPYDAKVIQDNDQGLIAGKPAKLKVSNVPIIEEEPEKKVNGETGTVALENRDSEFIYTVNHKIPAGATTVTFEDKLEDVLEVVGTPTINVDDVTPAVDGQKVTAIIDDEDVLKDLVGKTVTLTIKAKIKEGVTDDVLLKKYAQTTDIPNTAKVSINDNGKSTNTVKVTPPPEEEEPEKKVNGETGTVALENRDSEFTYTVVQKVPANATTVTFEDELEDVLEVVSAEMVDAKSSYEDQSDLDKNIVKFHTEDAKADRGNTVTLKIVAKIKEGVTDVDLVKKYGDITVPNKATVKINNNPKTTNEVNVTPPEEPTEEPEKKINGQKEKVTLDRRYETFVYTIEQKIPAKAVNVVFEDTLEGVLEVVGTPTINVMGVDPVVNGQKVTATIDDATMYAGQTVVLRIEAKIKNSATEEELDAYTDRSIPNKATVTIDGNGKVTNEVLVTPPPVVPEDPVKKVNGSEKAYLANRDEEFTYTVSQRIPANAVNVEFEDTLEDVLEVVGTPSIDADGAVVEVKGQKVTATIADATQLEDKIVTLTIQAKIKESATEEELDAYTDRRVPNKATVTINGNGKATNEVVVIPPEIPGEPEKEINGQKDLVNLIDRDEEFVYTVSQEIPIGARKVVFEDTLEDVLEILGADIDADGSEIVIETATESDDQAEESGSDEETSAKIEPVIDGQTVTATIEDAIEMGLEGKLVTLTIRAKISAYASNAELDAYADRHIPNKATVTINDNGQVTNTVFVEPPEPVYEDPEKFVNGQKELVELSDRKAPFTYTITQKIPTGAVNVVFEDTLEDVLEATAAEIDVAGVDAVIDGQKVTATIEDARALGNTVVTLTISARIKDSATNLDLDKYTDRQIPNVANVSIDGNGRVTNEVLVTPPTVVIEEPIKKVNGQDKVALSKKNEVFTYTVSQMVPLGSSTVKFEDTLEDVLEVVGTPEIDVEGAVIKVNGQTVTVEIKDAKACEGKIVVLTIKARIKADATDEDLAAYTNLEIPNVATVVLDNYVNVTNEVIVTPPTVVESEYKNDEEKTPEKTVVKGVKKIDTGDGQGIITYIVFALAAAVAMSVMITLRKRRDNA